MYSNVMLLTILSSLLSHNTIRLLLKKTLEIKKRFVQNYSEAPSENDLMLADEFAALFYY